MRDRGHRKGPPAGALAALALALLALLGHGCVDTTLPDLSGQLGGGPTDGPYCSPVDIDDFPPESLRVHVIDVGQGDAIWVQTPWYNDQQTDSLDILIDAGPPGGENFSPGGDVIVSYMGRRGLLPGDKIDTLIVTHAHQDHYGGVPVVAGNYDILRYVDPGFTAGSQGFLDARASVGTVSAAYPAVPALAPSLFEEIDVFGPFVPASLIWGADTPPSGNAANPSNSDVNNTSVAVQLEWAGRKVLLLGDLEAEVEQELVAAHDAGEISLASSVVKVGHHGSSTSSTAAFVERVFAFADSNSWAVISSGRQSFGGTQLPAESTVERLRELLPRYHVLSTENRDEDKSSTEEHGDDHVMITISPDGLVRACYAQ